MMMRNTTTLVPNTNPNPTDNKCMFISIIFPFYYNLIPKKLMKAIPIKPVMIKVIPNPFNGAGT